MKWIPIFGALTGTSVSAKKEGAIELGTNVIFSTTPIWLGRLIYLFFRGGEASMFSGYLDGLLKATGNGELFLYSTALLSPIFYIALSNKTKESAPYPKQFSHLFWFVILYLLSAIFFWVSRVAEPDKTTALLVLSIVVYLASVALLFTAYVLNNQRLDPVTEAQKQTSEFQKNYRAHRGH